VRTRSSSLQKWAAGGGTIVASCDHRTSVSDTGGGVVVGRVGIAADAVSRTMTQVKKRERFGHDVECWSEGESGADAAMRTRRREGRRKQEGDSEECERDFLLGTYSAPYLTTSKPGQNFNCIYPAINSTKLFFPPNHETCREALRSAMSSPRTPSPDSQTRVSSHGCNGRQLSPAECYRTA
jgi:hypothetical protein